MWGNIKQRVFFAVMMVIIIAFIILMTQYTDITLKTNKMVLGLVPCLLLGGTFFTLGKLRT
jgi:hypothetical protein